MTTFRTEDLASGDATTWHYDEATGLLVFKEYADGKGPTYDYTPDGRLSRRTWARGVTTDYAYDSQGRLISKNYSDSTPDVSLAYDRLGHTLSAICAGVSTNLYAYNRLGQLTNEVQNGTTIARNYDSLGRATGYAIGDGIAACSSVAYSFDTLGRLSSVSSADEHFAYVYVPGTPYINSVSNTHGLVRTNTYEPLRNLIATVENVHSNMVVARFDYDNDIIGRRSEITYTGSAFSSLSGSIDHYGYNDRSEVVSAYRTLNGEEIRGFSFGYAYDPIGNRTSSIEWDENGVARTSHYTVNELNEYEVRTVPRHVSVIGEALTNATVTVNGNPTWRKGAYFAGGYDFDNSSNSVFEELTMVAVLSTNTTDEEEITTGRKFLAQTPETFTYDADGNMTSDGRFAYSWDAENRLTFVTEKPHQGQENGLYFISNFYDYKSRRVGKVVLSDNSLCKSSWFVYDDLNMIVEKQQSLDTEICRSYVWGADLSQTLKNGGGVGGLLLTVNEDGSAFPFFDANGNLVSCISDSGSLKWISQYSFDGRILSSVQANYNNPFQFATKYFDDEIEAYGYLRRWYSPILSKWMSRDPLQELGGANLFTFNKNDSINKFDPFGLEDWNEATLCDLCGVQPDQRALLELQVTQQVEAWLKQQTESALPPFNWDLITGVSGTTYIPIAALCGGIKIDVSISMEAGHCCDKETNTRRQYRKTTGSIGIGAYGGIAPPVTIEPIGKLSIDRDYCPTQDDAGLDVSITASLHTLNVFVECSYSLISNSWSCPFGIDLFSAEISFDVTGSGAWTTVEVF